MALTARPTVRPVRAARAVAVAPRAEAGPVKRVASAAAAAALSVGFLFGAVTTPAALAAPSTLAAVEEELEAVEPIVAEDAPALAKTLGAGEVKEIVAEVQSIEKAVDALDARAAGAVGADTPALDKAAAPLLSRLEAVRELVGLAGAKQ